MEKNKLQHLQFQVSPKALKQISLCLPLLLQVASMYLKLCLGCDYIALTEHLHTDFYWCMLTGDVILQHVSKSFNYFVRELV